MGRTLLVVAVVLAAAFIAQTIASGSPVVLRPGDMLTYDIGIEVQVHVSPAPHTTQAPVAFETSATGTETITALGTAPDGTVSASVSVSLASNDVSGRRTLARTVLMKIKPDGSIQPGPGTDAQSAAYIEALSQAAQLYQGKKLYVGETLRQTVSIPGPMPMKMTTQAKVTGENMYRGYPTFAIQSTGSATINTILYGMKATGTADEAGTTYVDQQDHLLIGAAVRSDVNALVGGDGGNHTSVVYTMTLALRSYHHQSVRTPAPAASAVPPTAAPSPVPSASPSPPPTPASEYYTPTPPVPTPSPVYSAYPPIHRR